MFTFTDAAGNEWTIEFDVETIRRVRKETGFAFGTCLNDDMKTLNELLTDFEQLAFVLASILDEQLKKQGIGESTFVNNIKGDAIDAAQRAVWGAFAFFCPPTERRMMENIREATDKLTTDQLQSAEKMLSAYIEKHSNSGQSSESNPDLIALEN